MKKSLLIVTSLFVIHTVLAQVVLTKDINFSIGDTYRYDGYSEVTNIEPGPGGANLTWDFGTINGNFYTGIDAICVDPSTTPFADSSAVSDANICTGPVEGLGPYQYYNNDNSSQNLIAIGFVGASNSSFGTYTNILTACEFPFTYNDSFDDTWELISFNINEGYYFMRDSAFMTVEADAYGTITTPFGVFSNTLRVKTTTVDYSWMRIEPGGDWIPLGSFTDIEYKWYAPNIKTPVMFINEMEGFPTYEVRYLAAYDFSTGTEELSDHHLEVFPNPATDRVTVRTNEAINSVGLYSIQGQLLYTNSQLGQSHQQTIELSNYPKGVYVIKIGLEDGNLITKRFVKQ